MTVTTSAAVWTDPRVAAAIQVQKDLRQAVSSSIPNFDAGNGRSARKTIAQEAARLLEILGPFGYVYDDVLQLVQDCNCDESLLAERVDDIVEQSSSANQWKSGRKQKKPKEKQSQQFVKGRGGATTGQRGGRISSSRQSFNSRRKSPSNRPTASDGEATTAASSIPVPATAIEETPSQQPAASVKPATWAAILRGDKAQIPKIAVGGESKNDPDASPLTDLPHQQETVDVDENFDQLAQSIPEITMMKEPAPADPLPEPKANAEKVAIEEPTETAVTTASSSSITLPPFINMRKPQTSLNADYQYHQQQQQQQQQSQHHQQQQGLIAGGKFFFGEACPTVKLPEGVIFGITGKKNQAANRRPSVLLDPAPSGCAPRPNLPTLGFPDRAPPLGFPSVEAAGTSGNDVHPSHRRRSHQNFWEDATAAVATIVKPEAAYISSAAPQPSQQGTGSIATGIPPGYYVRPPASHYASTYDNANQRSVENAAYGAYGTFGFSAAGLYGRTRQAETSAADYYGALEYATGTPWIDSRRAADYSASVVAAAAAAVAGNGTSSGPYRHHYTEDSNHQRSAEIPSRADHLQRYSHAYGSAASYRQM